MGEDTKRPLGFTEDELNEEIKELDVIVNIKGVKSYSLLLNSMLELKQLRAEKRYRNREIDPSLK
jgi:hypothetical protein